MSIYGGTTTRNVPPHDAKNTAMQLVTTLSAISIAQPKSSSPSNSPFLVSFFKHLQGQADPAPYSMTETGESEPLLGAQEVASTQPKSSIVQRATGFEEPYNPFLWFIFGGALFAFCVSRLPLLDIDGFYARHGGVGEYYYMRQALYKGGMIVHLAGILLCNIIAVFQFLPIIRNKYLILHRINGYFIFFLYLLGAAAGIVITRHAYGGHVETQTAAGALSILVLIAFLIAWVQIKRLQVDQHRKWMLRAINMMASIVTSRVILAIATAIVNKIGEYYEVWPCSQLKFTVGDSVRFATQYPSCAIGDSTLVKAGPGDIENTGSGARITFGMSLWLAVAVHIILMEFYIHFTPQESARLRQYSYERQLQRGYKNPGSAGITGDMFVHYEGQWRPKTT